MSGIHFDILRNGNILFSLVQVKDVTTKVQQMLPTNDEVFQYQPYNFIYKVKSNRKSDFAFYNEASTARPIKHQTPKDFKFHEDIATSVKTQLTELHRSFSTLKVLLFTIQFPLDKGAMKTFQISLEGKRSKIYNFCSICN